MRYEIDTIVGRTFTPPSNQMKRLLPIAAATISASLVTAAPSQAREYRGTCYFNQVSMPCTVQQNLYTKTMIWQDGVIETYTHQGNGIFIDKRGGVWRPDPMNPNYMVHNNGNRIGFYEH